MRDTGLRNMYAPIALFAYNRVDHLRNCVEALKKNIHANVICNRFKIRLNYKYTNNFLGVQIRNNLYKYILYDQEI